MDGFPSIAKHLGAMESEELFRLRDHLRDLAAMPGWQALQELVQVQRDRSEHLAKVRDGNWTPTGLDGLIRTQAVEGHVAGYLMGLEHMAKIIEVVERTAEAVTAQLEEEARNE